MAFNGPVTVTKDGLECSGELGRCNGALGQGGWRFWSGLERLQDKAGFMSGPGACRLHKKHCVTHRGVRMQIRLIQARQSDHWQFLAYKTLLRAGIKWPAQRGFSLVQLRQGMAWLNAQQQRLQPVRQGQSTRIHQVPCELHRPSTGESGARVMLYVHGGAFFAGSPATHRGLCGQLAELGRMSVVVPDYRLAPEHPFPAALDDLERVYQGLLLQGWRADQIVVAGDSAGGGLSVMLAQRLRDAGQALPCCLLLLSPYVDYTFAQSSHTLRASRDPMLSVSVLKRGIAGLLGQQPLTARQLSPVFADLSGLPPLCIQVGSE